MAFNLDDIVERKLCERSKGGAEESVNVPKLLKKKKPSEPMDKDTSEDTVKKILTKYKDIPRAKWGDIPINTYIRYISSNDGKLKSGGRVMVIEKEDGSYIFTIKKFGRKPITWYANSKYIKHIFELLNPRIYENKATKASKLTNSIEVKTTGGSQALPNTVRFNEEPSEESSMMDQLGDKLLFADNDVLTKRIDRIEDRCDRIENELRKMFTMMKAMYKKSH